jgi:hypothetical protein
MGLRSSTKWLDKKPCSRIEPALPLFPEVHGASYTIIEGWKPGSMIFESGGYGYMKDADRHNVLYLKCRRYNKVKCPARAKIEPDSVKLFMTKGHTCDAVKDHEPYERYNIGKKGPSRRQQKLNKAIKFSKSSEQENQNVIDHNA